MLSWIFKFLIEHVFKVPPLPLYISIFLSFLWLNNSIYVQLTLEQLKVYSWVEMWHHMRPSLCLCWHTWWYPTSLCESVHFSSFVCSSDWIILIDLYVGSPYRSFVCTNLLLSPSVNFVGFTYCIFQLLFLFVSSLPFLSHHWYYLVRHCSQTFF